MSHLVLSKDGTRVYVSSGDSADPFELLEIDLATGDRTIVASATVGVGPAIGRIVAAGGGDDRLFALSFTDRGLVEVDLTTGDRVIISY